MLTVPLPLISIVLLITVLLRFWHLRQGDELARARLGFVGGCLIMLLGVAMRWTLPHSEPLMALRALLATLQPGWVLYCLAPLFSARAPRHALVLMACSAAVYLLTRLGWYGLLDGYNFCLSLAVGLLLWRWLPGRRPQWHSWQRASRYRLLTLASLMLLSDALISGVISLDLLFSDGRHVATILLVTQLLLIGILVTALVASSRPPVTSASIPHASTDPVQTVPPEPLPASAPLSEAVSASDEDHQIMAQLRQLLSDQPLYLDPSLTLQKVARKAGIPGRQISAAVNRLTDGNFSQWINAYRIDAICQQLRHSELPVTELMLAGGFQTKSNFNREFRRLTGMSPSEYRQQTSPSATPSPASAAETSE
ncbi:AraC family transcriptional regulator [Pokkaliibacter sp. MBI-7]|uniref:helix-turn-helix domain-containing protein n=1 Tax=Pokkaliibacter sp. MBI-7 TaxID=3040600 RepID=UPI00244713C4|nr:AraC family transcriptional regulator [Pokkaliibacter sp. MBI-7]MDH2433032.1 AraC family transcriptional regulator [Pokkaliibacter sp. MBI-7]